MALPELVKVPGFPGYLASRCGRVFSSKSGTFKEISPFENNGYLRVSLSGPHQRNVLVHRMIALAYIGGRPDESRNSINHIDGNKKNNNVTNLEYVTFSENAKHAVSTGLTPVRRGNEVGNSKLSPKDIDHILAMIKIGWPKSHIATRYAVDPSLIGHIFKGRCWSHHTGL